MSGTNSGTYTSTSLEVSIMSGGLAIMILFVITRIYTKSRIIKKVTWDDATCAIAVICAVPDYVASVLLFNGGFGKGTLTTQAKSSIMIPHYFTIVIVPITLLFTKLSFYLLYHQIFHHITHLRWLTYMGAFVTTTFYIASSISQFVLVTPAKGQTVDFMIQQNRGHLNTIGLALGFFGVVSDFYILLIPITGLLRLRLEWRRKLGVMLVFLTGLLACIASTANLYYRLRSDRSHNDDHSTRPIALLSVLEILIGISCSCMPAFAAVIRLHVFPVYDFLKACILSILSSIHSLLSPMNPKSHQCTGHYDDLEDGPCHIKIFKPLFVQSLQLELGSLQSDQSKEGVSQTSNLTPDVLGV